MKILTVFLTFLLIFSCSKAPEQYSEKQTSFSRKDKDMNSEDTGEIELTNIGTGSNKKNEVKLIDDNSMMPITYGLEFSDIGVSGISLATTKSEAIGILSIPRITVFRKPHIVDVYSEGFNIYWRTSEPFAPALIWLTGHYKGALEVGGKIGTFKIGTPIDKWFNDQNKMGEGFVTTLYNEIHNKDEDYNCLKEYTCRIKKFESYYLFFINRLIMLVSSDRFIVSDIRLSPEGIQGVLASDYDLLNGEFIIDENDSSKNIKLGETWKSFTGKYNQEARSSKDVNYFLKDYGGVKIGVSKLEDYARSYNNPSDNELFNMVYLGSLFNNFIKINNKYIMINKTDAGIVPTLSDTITSTGTALRILPDLPHETKEDENNLKMFIKRLSGEIVKELEKSQKFKSIKTLFTGFHDTDIERNFGSKILIHKNDDTYREIEYSFKAIEGNINAFQDYQMTRTSAEKIMPNLINKIDVSKTPSSLAGFKIGDRVELLDIDESRGEATISFNGISDRIKIGKVDTMENVYKKDGKLLYDEVRVISELPGEVFLAVSKTSKENEYKIVEITVGSFYEGVTGICGISSTTFTRGDQNLKVIESITSKLKDNNECNTYTKRSEHGDSTVSVIYFIDQGVKFEFTGNGLAGIAVYKRPNEVK